MNGKRHLHAIWQAHSGNTKEAQLPWLAVGKYDDFSELCHFDQVLVILWAGSVWDDRQALFVGGTVREDEFPEYRDHAFLDRLGVSLPKRRLEDFWPSGGPQWDALGRASSGEIVLVEAKAHVTELLSPPTKATDKSAEIIRRSLFEAADGLHALPGTDWSRRFYQYGNRFAHTWFLTHVNGLPVRLAFIYFIGDVDMDGPSSRRERESALTVLQRLSACKVGCRAM